MMFLKLFGKIKNPQNQVISMVSRIFICGTPEGIRTPDLLVRSQTLYPTELPARNTLLNCKYALYAKTTVWFVASHSIQLSYRHICLTTLFIIAHLFAFVKGFFKKILKKPKKVALCSRQLFLFGS